jgi:FG-GAP-like repeat
MATLTKGDIAFTSFNTDEDGFSIVTFVDIEPNTTIYFTDNEALSPTSFNTGESYQQWVSPTTTVAAGTVIRFLAVDLTTLSASVGTLSRATVALSTNYGISQTADIVYAFLGTSAAAPSTILTAISSGDIVSGLTPASTDINLPFTNAGLTVGTNAIRLRTSADYGEYGQADNTVIAGGNNGVFIPTGNTSRSGKSIAEYKASVFNVANWSFDQGDGGYATAVPNTTPFTITAALPTVNLSVNTNTGSEAGTTAVTVTATASAPVTGAQTVTLGVTGNGIRNGDYTLSSNTISIASGALTGSVTFTVVDDVIVETAETAILTLSAPSAGITLGNVLTQNIAITDNDVAPISDQKSDIVWRNNDGQVAIWQMNGATVTSAGLTSVPVASTTWTIAGTGDFDGDGKSDILWRDKIGGTVAIWKMDGTEITSSGFTSVPVASTTWTIAGTGDFDGDGKSDILWRDEIGGTVAIWKMDGTEIASSGFTSVPVASTTWTIAGTGDFDGDGKSDILWRDKIGGTVAIWKMDGTEITSSGFTSVTETSTNWKIAGTGDFTGDAKSDILWRNDDGSVKIWQMNGIAATELTVPTPATYTTAWQIAGTGDFSGDGQSDILWRKDSGQVSISQISGLVGTTTTSLTSLQPDDATWKVAGTTQTFQTFLA